MVQTISVLAKTVLELLNLPLLFTACHVIIIHQAIENFGLIRAKDNILLGNFAHAHFHEVNHEEF